MHSTKQIRALYQLDEKPEGFEWINAWSGKRIF